MGGMTVPAVTAVLVTRGNVVLDEILASLPSAWPVVIWDNSQREDLAVYGRYAALAEIETPFAYVQDDDCVLEEGGHEELLQAIQENPTALVANMEQPWRHDFYVDHCLVGFGAIFHRDLPARAFDRFLSHYSAMWTQRQTRFFRLCDVIFTGLTPRHLVDVPHRDLPWASGPDRMWKQSDHQAERTEMLGLVRKVRDA